MDWRNKIQNKNRENRVPNFTGSKKKNCKKIQDMLEKDFSIVNNLK